MFRIVKIILKHKNPKYQHAIGRASFLIRQPSTLKVTKSRNERISVKLPGFGFRLVGDPVGGVNLHQFVAGLNSILWDESKILAFYEKLNSNRHRFIDSDDEDVLTPNLTLVNTCLQEVLGRNQSARRGESNDARHSAIAAAAAAAVIPEPSRPSIPHRPSTRRR